jgi:hypothetical protein
MPRITVTKTIEYIYENEEEFQKDKERWFVKSGNFFHNRTQSIHLVDCSKREATEEENKLREEAIINIDLKKKANELEHEKWLQGVGEKIDITSANLKQKAEEP